MGRKWGAVDWESLAFDVRRSVVAGREGATKTKTQKSPYHLTTRLLQPYSTGDAKHITAAHLITSLQATQAKHAGRP
jgi:hypothetical protein